MGRRKPPGEARVIRFPLRLCEEDVRILRSIARENGVDAAGVVRLLIREERRRLDALLARHGADSSRRS